MNETTVFTAEQPADTVPVKRGRGRPRKVPVQPVAPVEAAAPVVTAKRQSRTYKTKRTAKKAKSTTAKRATRKITRKYQKRQTTFWGRCKAFFS